MFRLLIVSVVVTFTITSNLLSAGETSKTGTAGQAYGEVKPIEAPKPVASNELVPIEELDWFSNKLKKIPVGPTKVSFGAHHQTRVEVWDNKFLPGQQVYTNGVTFIRNRVWMDWDFHEHLRMFAMFQDATKDGDLKSAGRTWENHSDLLEAYLDIRKIGGIDLTFRIGRQPLVYGRQRLVGAFEWSNPGRRFDALKLMWKSDDKKWSVDAFASKVVVVDPIKFDKSEPTEEFYGLYATNNSIKYLNFDVYWFYRTNDNGKILDELQRQGDLDIHTIGGRLYGKNIFGGLDYEIEGTGQFGEVGKADHLAGALHAETGWTFSPKWKPRLMGEFNFGSGDKDPTDGKSGTFNNLYPTNHLHYGDIDYFNWSNTINAAIGFTAEPIKNVTVWAKGYRFWLHQEKDAWRNAGGGVLARDRTGKSGNEVGWEFDVGVHAIFNKFLNFQSGFALFEGSEFVKNRRPGQSEQSRFFWAQLQFNF